MLRLVLACWVLGAAAASDGSRCEEITIPMCRGIGYNLTSMPNELNHDTQEEAGLEVHQFWPLVEIKCSKDLLFFLCSMYSPICIEDYHQPLPACRSVCERARNGCSPLMEHYGFKWPDRMSCDKFPRHGDPDALCMDKPDGLAAAAATNAPSPPLRPTRKPPAQNNKCKNKNGKGCNSPSLAGKEPSVDAKDCQCRCRSPLVPIGRDSLLFNRSVSVSTVDNCALPCYGVFFSPEERDFASVWITVWSALCCVSTLMTVTTFLIDTQRFKYPERPIVFLSACYFMVSVGYLVRVGLGHEEVACHERIIRYHSTGPVPCTLVFLLIYFFGMASSIWWVILTLTWFLAAGLKWGNEAIAGYSQYFHLAAWLVPTVKSVAVLVMSAVDGDAVAGVCYVGNQNADNLRIFVMAPLVAYLFLGTSFLLAGFVSLFRIRNVIKQQGRSKADKLEKLMIRIGIFSVLYTVPATIVIGCHFYESHRDWLAPWTCPCHEQHRPRPLYSILMLKYFMALAVGITSGVWIWSGKTLDSWRRFWFRITGRRYLIESNTAKRSVVAKPLAVGYSPAVTASTMKQSAPLSHV
ncbi:frizzled-2-like isoform X2 [Neocloeon triangulifer]|nr:frizzled-2-like isoform X2 [Neocloeon triangulifer]XP_059490874.1 frizzled-2-like isoform X2 [Neocloeon triangulifer]XP_059490876.1 frizzled-2-like isoform X2 [Neocloeon triangulifer]